MKYTKFIIALFYLISLVNLKRPKLNFKSFIAAPSEEDNEEICHNSGTDKNQCKATKLTDGNFQCCYIKSTNSQGTEEECNVFPYPAKDVANMVKFQEFSPLMKEYIGFSVYGPYGGGNEKEMLEEIRMKSDVSCKDTEMSVQLGYDEYSEEDKKILKSEDYCMQYYINSLLNGGQSKPDCKNGKVLESSKNSNIECGNLEIKMKIQGETQKVKTCFFYSYNFYSNITPELFKNYFQAMILQQPGFDSYTMTFSDSNGENRISFSSED